MVFKNVHGQEPSSPLPADTPLVGHIVTPSRPHRKQSSIFVQRMGHEPIDPARCQAPVEGRRCENAAACVIVENKPRPNGLVAAMSLCAFHRDALLKTKGAAYAHITPLTP